MMKSVSILILILILGSVAFSSSNKIDFRPYEFWLTSQYANLVDDYTCPENWDFSSLKIKKEWPKTEDILLVIKAGTVLQDKNLPPEYKFSSPGSFDGNSGVDTMLINATGRVNLDGYQLISFEILDTKNDKPNVINILLSGLATADNNKVVISGDPQTDIVYLDGCLTWGFPTFLEADKKLPGRWQFKATDIKNDAAMVEIAEGLEIRLIPRQRINAWAIIIR